MKQIRITIGLLISAGLLFLVFRGIDFGEVWAAMRDIEPLWLLLAIAVYFGGIVVRTTRWGLLMRSVKPCSTWRLFPIYVISYMANNVLPFRMGDIYRAYIVGKKDHVSKSATLVTIVVERIFDGLTMLLLLSIAVMLYPVSNPAIQKTLDIGSTIFIGAILACYLFLFNRKLAHRAFAMIVVWFPIRLRPRLSEMFNNLFIGLGILKGVGSMLNILVLSILTWLVEALSYHIVLISFGFSGNFVVAVSAMALVNLFIIAPAGPGYFGPFEFACVAILGSRGYGAMTSFNQETATAFALILHVVVQWIPSTLLGLIFMWREHISFREIRDENATGAMSDAGALPKEGI